jgi:hypothetical protein
MGAELEYRSPSTEPRDHEGTLYLILLRIACAYLLLGSLTIPFANALWIGELPLLALVQVPKLFAANGLRHQIVMRVLAPMGFSGGWYSPNWMLARPWALAVVYVVPLTLILTIVAFRRGTGHPWRKWLVFAAVLGVVDYFITLAFGSTRALTMY